MTTGLLVLKMVLIPSRHRLASRAKSGPRWSIIGVSIARSTRSGSGVGPGICRKWRLRGRLLGDVKFDTFTRGRYATDASHYQMMPVGVVAPRSIKEAEHALALAREEGVSVLPRGGGTSQAGQAVNNSLVIDCSK